MPTCPNCGSQKVWKDGLRYTISGNLQRYICRECGYRFSENSGKRKNKELLRKFVEELECQDRNESRRRALVSMAGTISLAAEPQNEKRAAGATENETTSAEIKGKIIEYIWYLKKSGKSIETINSYSSYLQNLLKMGIDLYDPEQVKGVIAKNEVWNNRTKQIYACCYDGFVKWLGLKWERPKYKPEEKLPFIPTEEEIDQLIAASGKKTAALLQLLKETGMRVSEARKIEVG